MPTVTLYFNSIVTFHSLPGKNSVLVRREGIALPSRKTADLVLKQMQHPFSMELELWKTEPSDLFIRLIQKFGSLIRN